jgi:hypothetical protein
MPLKKPIIVTLFTLMMAPAIAQNFAIPHLESRGSTKQLIVKGKPFLMLGGELHNSSTSGVEYMRPIWKRMADANLNTVIASASWELVEPVEGKYDFVLVDSMIIGARKEGLKLIVLWFGTWKNGMSTYVPAWVKKDPKRFPLVKDEKGNTLNVVTTLSTEARDADARAFAALMKHIKEIDGKDQTVIMVQVENEIGTLGTKRDFSDMANRAFNGPVPPELMRYLEKNKSTIHLGVLEAWKKQGFKMSGTWEEVFGKGVRLDNWKDMSYLTEELFMAWNYAKYVGAVAAAGRAEYNLPMYVNAWLKQPGNFGYAPGNYPSGGPTPQMIDVWRAGAPAIDFISPDIYATSEWRYVCDTYTQSGNPLFIPETRSGLPSISRAFFTFGKYNTELFAPFGIDGNEGNETITAAELAELKEAYSALKQLAPLILKNQGTKNMTGLMVDQNMKTDSVIIGGYKITGRLGRRFGGAEVAGFDIFGNAPGASQTPPEQVGGAIIICTAPGEYIISGRNMSIDISSTNGSSNVSFLSLETGTFDGTTWVPKLRLNGDEFRITLAPDRSKIFKASVYQY